MRGEVEELKTVLEQERQRRQEVQCTCATQYLLSSLPLCVHCLPPQSEASAMEKEVELTQALSRLGEYERVRMFHYVLLYCVHVCTCMHACYVHVHAYTCAVPDMLTFLRGSMGFERLCRRSR